jgi:uncharacterized membrane protein YraQ (UPF0718 family)
LGRKLPQEELRDWLWEAWRFVKQIFPLLIVGVFTVGIIRELIRPEWIEAVAGNLAGVYPAGASSSARLAAASGFRRYLGR